MPHFAAFHLGLPCLQKNLWKSFQYSKDQGSKIVLVRSYLRVSQAAGQVNILIFLLKIKFSTCMPISFVTQGKYLFSDISRPEDYKVPVLTEILLTWM